MSTKTDKNLVKNINNGIIRILICNHINTIPVSVGNVLIFKIKDIMFQSHCQHLHYNVGTFD